MIDINKTYRTRNGREVRIYATDGAGIRPVHGAIKTDEGWVREDWSSDGGFGGNMRFSDDLIEVRPRHKRTVWVNVYDDTCRTADSKQSADAYATANRIACIKIELDFEEGEGL